MTQQITIAGIDTNTWNVKTDVGETYPPTTALETTNASGTAVVLGVEFNILESCQLLSHSFRSSALKADPIAGAGTADRVTAGDYWVNGVQVIGNQTRARSVQSSDSMWTYGGASPVTPINLVKGDVLLVGIRVQNTGKFMSKRTPTWTWGSSPGIVDLPWFLQLRRGYYDVVSSVYSTNLPLEKPVTPVSYNPRNNQWIFGEWRFSFKNISYTYTSSIPSALIAATGINSFNLTIPATWRLYNMVEWELQFAYSQDGITYSDWIPAAVLSPAEVSYTHSRLNYTNIYKYRYQVRTRTDQSSWSAEVVAGQPKLALSASDITGIAAEPSHEIDAPGEPILGNAWVNYDPAYNSVGFWKDAFGVVHLKGSIKSGTMQTTAFTLPPGYRPAKNEATSNLSVGAFGGLRIFSSGAVAPWEGTNAYFSLDGVTFRAA